MVCPLCGERKAKRACPALNRHICAVCCGTKRLVEINCPADCVYLRRRAVILLPWCSANWSTIARICCRC